MADKFEDSKEMNRLYRAFSFVQILGIEYVRKGKDDKQKIDRAKKVADALIQTIKNLPKLHRNVSDDGKCWDPVTKQYVDCIFEAQLFSKIEE